MMRDSDGSRKVTWLGIGLGSGIGLGLKRQQAGDVVPRLLQARYTYYGYTYYGYTYYGCTLCPASCRREPQFMIQSCAPPRMVRSLYAHGYSLGAHVFRRHARASGYRPWS